MVGETFGTSAGRGVAELGEFEGKAAFASVAASSWLNAACSPADHACRAVKAPSNSEDALAKSFSYETGTKGTDTQTHTDTHTELINKGLTTSI